MRRLATLVPIALMIALVVPIVIRSLIAPGARSLSAVRLADTLYEEIQFANAAQGIQLAGMLFVPEGPGPFPAAVVIHGSGTSRRDSGWYLTLAKYLHDRGVLVLLPDKRGSVESGGDWRSASFEDLATDTLAAIEYLEMGAAHPVDGIGVIGMSQGGWIAPIVADRSPTLRYVVNVVGAAVRPREQLQYEENLNLRQAGVLPGLSNLLAYVSAWSIRQVRQKPFWDAVGDFDPLPYWQRLGVPALVLYGERDTNVPTAESVDRLRALANPLLDVRVYGHSGHALEDPPGLGDSIFRSDALADIVAAIHQAVASGR